MQTAHKIFFHAFGMAVLTSCNTQIVYEHGKAAVSDIQYRTDQISPEVPSIAETSWRDIFTDPILQKHIANGLQNNIDIRIALQNIISAEAYLRQSKSAYLPTINVGPNYSLNSPSINANAAFPMQVRRYMSNFDISVGANWEIDISGKLAAQERAQLAEYLQTQSAHLAIKTELVAAISTAYYQLVTYDEQKRIISETILVRQKNLETTKALKEAGILTEVAVQQSEALVYNAQTLLVNLAVQSQLLENATCLLLGITSQPIERSNLAMQNFPTNIGLGYPVNLLSNRPDVKAAEYNLMNAFELTNAAKASFYPTLRITASTGLQASSIDQLFSLTSIFGNIAGGLLQPVLNKRQIRTQYEVSLSQKETAMLNFRKTLLNAGKQVSDALKIFESQDQIIALKNKELSAYQKSVEYSQQLVNYGMANYLEVLNASVNQLNAELQISNARFTKLQASIELYRALGGGWK